MKNQGRQRNLRIGATGIPLLYEDHIRSFIEGWKGEFTITDSDATCLMISALSPEKLGEENSKHLQKHFAKLFAAHPDFVLAFMSSIRKKSQKNSNVFVVKQFLMSNHGWIDSGTHVNSDHEKLMHIESLLAAKLNVHPDVVKKAIQELSNASK